MGVAYDMQDAGTLVAGGIATMRNERAPNALVPGRGIYKQGIYFKLAVTANNHGCETQDRAWTFGSEDATGFNQTQGDVYRIWMGQQCFAVSGVTERCAPLQGFQGRMVAGQRGAYGACWGPWGHALEC